MDNSIIQYSSLTINKTQAPHHIDLDPHTGVFTAHIDGVYSVSVSAVADNYGTGHGTTRLDIR